MIGYPDCKYRDRVGRELTLSPEQELQLQKGPGHATSSFTQGVA